MKSFFVLLATILCAAPLLGQSTEPELKARLVHRPLYLRGQWRETHLKFDSSGELSGTSKLLSFTLSGIDINSVKLDSNGLKLDAQRMGLVYVNGKMSRTPLDERIRIEVASPSNGDYTAALDKIFLTSAADFIPNLPDYWRGSSIEALIAGSPPPVPVRKQSLTPAAPPRNLTPPRVLSQPQPVYTEFARRAKLTGNVLVHTQVDTSGNPINIRILRPLGLGLDENAVATVAGYRFKPAADNGQPVQIEMNIEVNFQIFDR